ncbi:hypothetical protein [Peribacillus acanthi]|uniref:hypothetical protein n=1 Tax=Peribacillus acanthi TaxID=2171554 RepID=UPI000D3EDB65|nr:hypothetical protein [Peribacillus acanthi]
MIITKEIYQQIVHYQVPEGDMFVGGTYLKGFQIKVQQNGQNAADQFDKLKNIFQNGAFPEECIVGTDSVTYKFRLKEIANIPFTEAYEAMLELYGKWIVKKLEKDDLTENINIQVDIDHLYNMPRNISQFRDFLLNTE